MNDIVDILAGVMNDLENDLVHSLQAANRVSSGKTLAGFQTIITPTTAQLIVPLYLDALETGRKPTSEGAPKGDPTLFEQIEDWCQARGIAQFAAYAITKKIHKEGYAGTPGVISDPISDDNVNNRLNKGLDQIANIFGTQVIDLFNVLEDA